jgi:glyoxylase-like metal-dependent hydrolase (beta-lactamase superfamily II)
MSWYTVTCIAPDVYRIAEPLGVVEPRYGIATANAYLVLGAERAALIDSGMGIGDLRAEVTRLTSRPCIVLNTHSHWDHSGGNLLFAERAIHEREAHLLDQAARLGGLACRLRRAEVRALLPAGFDPAAYRIGPRPATRTLRDGERIDLGGREIHVLHTPGHSPGHAAYLEPGAGLLFTGDTAYRGPVFACFEGGDPAALAGSLRRLAALPGVQAIAPGHNDVIRDPGWLRALSEGMEAALAGEIEGRWHDGFLVGREFRLADFSLWLPC